MDERKPRPLACSSAAVNGLFPAISSVGQADGCRPPTGSGTVLEDRFPAMKGLGSVGDGRRAAEPRPSRVPGCSSKPTLRSAWRHLPAGADVHHSRLIHQALTTPSSKPRPPANRSSTMTKMAVSQLPSLDDDVGNDPGQPRSAAFESDHDARPGPQAIGAELSRPALHTARYPTVIPRQTCLARGWQVSVRTSPCPSEREISAASARASSSAREPSPRNSSRRPPIDSEALTVSVWSKTGTVRGALCVEEHRSAEAERQQVHLLAVDPLDPVLKARNGCPGCGWRCDCCLPGSDITEIALPGVPQKRGTRMA